MEGYCVIGDIHGCYKSFLALVKKLPDCKKICVGDLIDRGPDSKKIVQFMIENKDEYSCVMGNHEYMLLEASKHDYYTSFMAHWLKNGGNKTLESYGGEIDPEHFKFLTTLPSFWETEDLFVSHSSYNNDFSLTVVTKHLFFEQSIIWNRAKISPIPNKFHVFGHTPLEKPEITDFYANIDTGCVYNKDGRHNLTALHYPSMNIFQQKTLD